MADLNQEIDDKQRRKLLSILAHGSILFSGSIVVIGIPITMLLLSKDDVVIANAKEALNFCLTIYILCVRLVLLYFLLAVFSLAVFHPISLIVIGLLVLVIFSLLILFGIATLVMPIFAIIKIARHSDRVYRYPLIMHIL